MDRWILSHYVSAYPIHISSSFKDTASKWRGILLLLQHLSWVASHRAVCSSLDFLSSGLSRLPVARYRTLILVKLLGIHSLFLSSIYNYKLAYLFGTCTPATGSPNERLSSEVIFLLRKESVLRCFGAHSCCQQTYLYRQNPVKGLAYWTDLLIFNVFFPMPVKLGLTQQRSWRLRKRHLIITLNASRLIRDMLANLVVLNTKRLYRSWGKEKESRCLVSLPPQNVKLGTFTSKSWGDGKKMYKKASLWTGSLFGERVKKYFFFDVFVAVAVVVARTFIGKPRQTISRKLSHCIPLNDTHPSNNRFPSVSLPKRRREKV